MKTRIGLGVSMALALVLLFVLVYLTTPGEAAPVLQQSDDTCFVEISGNNETDFSSADASALQDALDALAPTSNTVKVAGTCAGVQNVGGYTQTLYIARSNITIQGGYTPTAWLDDPNPETYPTVLDAQSAGRVVLTPRNTKVQNVTLDGLHITNGDALNVFVGACWNDASDGGGLCLSNVSNFTIQNSVIYSNTAGKGGGLYHYGGGDVVLSETAILSNTASGSGGGIFNRYDSVTLENSVVSNNTASGNGGGLFLSRHRLSMVNTTFSGNGAVSGGGMYLESSGTDVSASILHSTIVSNTATSDGGGIYRQNTATTITNTLVAYNRDNDGSSQDCYGQITSGDYNLVQDDTGCTLTGTLTHVITGTDPLLDPLADNGGDTWTHALLSSSPAVDWIPYGTNGCGTSIAEDQRGVTRPQHGACDIGAVEVQPVCYAEISGDGVTDYFSEDAAAVQIALDALDPTSDTIKLGGTCTGVQMRTGFTQTVYISRSLTLRGGYTYTNWLGTPDSDLYPTTLDAQQDGRVVYIQEATVALDGLILTGGNAHGAGGSVFAGRRDHGGAIRMHNATLDLSNSTLYDNHAYYGGGIFSGGPVALSNTLLISNTAGYRGGGFYSVASDYTLTASQVLSNSAPEGGGMHIGYSDTTVTIGESTVAYNQSDSFGGGIASLGAALILMDSTVHANSTGGNGGGLYISWDGSLVATNSTFSGNSGSGGAIYQTGVAQGVTLTHSTVAANRGSPAGLSLAVGATISSTILANDGGSNCGGSGILVSGGYNLSMDSSCALTGTGDITNTAALLGSLADNGGETLTHLPLSLSPAIDAIPATSCSLSTDQRGSVRPIEGACDIGAVELAQEYAPIAVSDAYTTTEETTLPVATPGVLSNDHDGDWDSLTCMTVVVDPGGGAVTLAADGSFVYTPTLDFFGADSFTYTVSDGILTDTATVSLTVTNVNDAPVADTDAFNVDEDSTENVLDVLEGDGDVDGDTLTVFAVGDPSHGLTVDSDTEVLYTPTLDFNGTDSFTYTVSDGNGGTDTATVTVTVSSLNDPPVADDDAFNVDEDSTENVLDVLEGDGDVDGDTLTVFAVGDPSHGLAVDSDTEVLYTPDADFSGTDTFTYTVSDGNGGFDIATVTVTVLRYDTKVYLPMALRPTTPQAALGPGGPLLVAPDASGTQEP